MIVTFDGSLLVGAEPDRVADHLVEFHRRACGVALARERLEVADDARRPLGGVVNRIEIASRQLVEPAARQPLGAGEDRAEWIVQLVRDARDRLTERRQFLRLRKLMEQVARLVLELLALGDVAHHRFEPERGGRAHRFGAGGHFDPHRGTIEAAQPQQVVVRAAVASELLKKRRPRLLVDEPVRRRAAGRRRAPCLQPIRISGAVVDWPRASRCCRVGRGRCTGLRADLRRGGRTRVLDSRADGRRPEDPAIQESYHLAGTLAGSADGAPSPHR